MLRLWPFRLRLYECHGNRHLPSERTGGSLTTGCFVWNPEEETPKRQPSNWTRRPSFSMSWGDGRSTGSGCWREPALVTGPRPIQSLCALTKTVRVLEVRSTVILVVTLNLLILTFYCSKISIPIQFPFNVYFTDWVVSNALFTDKSSIL